MNIVEMMAADDETKPALCAFGNIVKGHACYCHHTNPEAPRKCWIWRNYGEEPEYWFRKEWHMEMTPTSFHFKDGQCEAGDYRNVITPPNDRQPCGCPWFEPR